MIAAGFIIYGAHGDSSIILRTFFLTDFYCRISEVYPIPPKDGNILNKP